MTYASFSFWVFSNVYSWFPRIEHSYSCLLLRILQRDERTRCPVGWDTKWRLTIAINDEKQPGASNTQEAEKAGM